jgi:hypothetical protein
MTDFPTNIRPRWGHFIRSTCRLHTEQLASPTFNCTPKAVLRGPSLAIPAEPLTQHLTQALNQILSSQVRLPFPCIVQRDDFAVLIDQDAGREQ